MARGREDWTSPSTISSFGAGKVILLGEHAVVYGHHALAAPLSWGVSARGVRAQKAQLTLPKELKGAGRRLVLTAFKRASAAAGNPHVRVKLQSDLPPSMGLGSSAALAVACARLLLQAAGRPTSIKDVVRVAGQMEQVFHGRPSGIDHTCSAQGRMILFRRYPSTAEPQVRPIQSRRPIKLLVALAGVREPTQHVVAALRERGQRSPARHARLFAEIGRVVLEGARAIEAGDLEALGEAFNVNHGLLSALGLTSEPIDRMVYRLRRLGALGAKLTGAGGGGGAVIGLFREPEPSVAKLTREGVQCFGSQVGGPRAL
jgi:mevalonate kinase